MPTLPTPIREGAPPVKWAGQVPRSAQQRVEAGTATALSAQRAGWSRGGRGRPPGKPWGGVDGTSRGAGPRTLRRAPCPALQRRALPVLGARTDHLPLAGHLGEGRPPPDRRSTRRPEQSRKDVSALVVDLRSGERVAVAMNGLGSTSREELFVLYADVADALSARVGEVDAGAKVAALVLSAIAQGLGAGEPG